MPILKASKKALRNSRAKQARNSMQMKRLKTSIKKVEDKSVNSAISLVDKAAKTGLIHPNKAARLKSRLAKKIGGTPKAEPKATIVKSVKKKTSPSTGGKKLKSTKKTKSTK